MIFSESELVFLNSLSDGGKILGVHLSLPRKEMEKEYVQKTIESLKKKRILNESGQLRKIGAAPAYALEQYKQAKKHVIINNLKAALLPKGRAIVIVPVTNGYDISISNTTSILVGILQHAEYLCKADNTFGETQIWYEDYDEWTKEFRAYRNNHLLIGSFEGFKVLEEKVLYWNEENGYEYDLHLGEKKQCGPLDMRKYLLHVLGMAPIAAESKE